MEPRHHLTKTAYLYVACVIAAGISVTGHSAFVLITRPVANQWMILAALT